MRKLVLALAALGAIGVAMPFAAPAYAASTVIIHKHIMHKHRHVYDVVPPRPLHHHHSKTIIIKHH
jgi:hypothetical protein